MTVKQTMIIASAQIALNEIEYGIEATMSQAARARFIPALDRVRASLAPICTSAEIVAMLDRVDALEVEARVTIAERYRRGVKRG